MPSIDPKASLQTALIVEDDPVFQRAIGEALIQAGGNWLIRSYRTGAEALNGCLHETIPPAIGLIDLGLPDMPGEKVISELRARFPEMPILVISVFSDERKVFSAIRAGAIGYLLKGDEVLETTAAIRSVLAGEYPISPTVARYIFKLVAAEGTEQSSSEMAPKLSKQEHDLLLHVAAGKSYVEAARDMGLKLSTVQSYSRNLYRKLGCHSQTQALSKAREYQLI